MTDNPENSPTPRVKDSKVALVPPPSATGKEGFSIINAPSRELITYSWKHINVWVGKAGTQGFTAQKAPSRAYSETRGETAISIPDAVEAKPKKWCFGKGRVPAKHLVNNVSGTVRPGELVAMMGASGAGKTTLLNVLTYRGGAGLHVTGERFMNGMPVGPEEVTAVSAYIQQEDLFFGTLTVYEHLVFYSHLRMDMKYTKAERMVKVHEVMEEFGLTKCKDTKIGIHGRVKGISGGEMKRLAFASEIMNDPQLMLADEPTSGLDSYMAENIVHVMKMLVARGKTIICTIHQPSSPIFMMFDRILLLAEGRTAFMGTVDEAVSFFAEQGLVCPQNFNPSDYFVHTLAIAPGRVEECKAFVSGICDHFEETAIFAEIMEVLNTRIEIDEYRNKMKASKHRSPYKAGWCSMFAIVLWRAWISVIHDPILLSIRFFQTLSLGITIGAVYFNTNIDREAGLGQDRVNDVAGVLYLLLANMSFQNIFSVLDGFLGEVPIFLREHFNGMYRTDVYFLTRMLADLPLFIIFPFLFHTITYLLIQFDFELYYFLRQGLVLIVTAQVAASFGYLLSCICKSLTTALTVGPGLLIPLMLFSGFFLRYPNMPSWNCWVTRISWFYFADEALMVNQLNGIKQIYCAFPVFCPASFDGSRVLESFNFKEENFYRNIFILLAMAVVFRLMAFTALVVKTCRK